jgi:hypothetical protein
MRPDVPKSARPRAGRLAHPVNELAASYRSTIQHVVDLVVRARKGDRLSILYYAAAREWAYEGARVGEKLRRP